MKKKTTPNLQRNLHVKVEPAKSFKTCKLCHESQSIENFYLSQKWHRNICKKCKDGQRTAEQRMLKDAKYRAKLKNLEFNLDLTDIIIPTLCPVFGTPMISNTKEKKDSPSLDRIDNSKGYTKDNIIVVSTKANLYKNSATIEELKRIVEFYDNLKSNK